jgi:hypothetical protein
MNGNGCQKTERRQESNWEHFYYLPKASPDCYYAQLLNIPIDKNSTKVIHLQQGIIWHQENGA